MNLWALFMVDTRYCSTTLLHSLGQDKTEQDSLGHDKTRDERVGQDKTGQFRTSHEMTRLHWTRVLVSLFWVGQQFATFVLY